MLTPGGIINICESYGLGGEATSHKRRDLRPGASAGRVELFESTDGGVDALGVRTVNEWGAPFAGGAMETFTLAADSVLIVETELWLADEPRPSAPLRYRAVYRRPGGR